MVLKQLGELRVTVSRGSRIELRVHVALPSAMITGWGPHTAVVGLGTSKVERVSDLAPTLSCTLFRACVSEPLLEQTQALCWHVFDVHP